MFSKLYLMEHMCSMGLKLISILEKEDSIVKLVGKFSTLAPFKQSVY